MEVLPWKYKKKFSQKLYKLNYFTLNDHNMVFQGALASGSLRSESVLGKETNGVSAYTQSMARNLLFLISCRQFFCCHF